MRLNSTVQQILVGLGVRVPHLLVDALTIRAELVPLGLQLIPYLLLVCTAFGLLALVVSAGLGWVNLLQRTGGDDVVQDDFFLGVALHPVLDAGHGGLVARLRLSIAPLQASPTRRAWVPWGCLWWQPQSAHLAASYASTIFLTARGHALTEQLVDATNNLVVHYRH
jgi:hypothetical protein